jgi:hypothetical protein
MMASRGAGLAPLAGNVAIFKKLFREIRAQKASAPSASPSENAQNSNGRQMNGRAW